MTTSDLNVAKESLRARESVPPNRCDDYIGVLNVEEDPGADPIRNTLIQWLKDVAIDAVIWTDLPAKFGGKNGVKPSMEEAITYLQGLDDNIKKLAEEYIRKAPPQIMTEYRLAFEEELGWIYGDLNI